MRGLFSHRHTGPKGTPGVSVRAWAAFGFGGPGREGARSPRIPGGPSHVTPSTLDMLFPCTPRLIAIQPYAAHRRCVSVHLDAAPNNLLRTDVPRQPGPFGSRSAAPTHTPHGWMSGGAYADEGDLHHSPRASINYPRGILLFNPGLKKARVLRLYAARLLQR